jgi:hypothetical protein
LIGDRAVSESRLVDGLVFRLGANGPMLRFDSSANIGHRSETLDSIDPDMLNLLDIDQERKAQEVEQIADNELFRQLLEQSKQKKSS